MTQILNLSDIQGNVTRAYGRFSFPFARYFFFRIRKAQAGRDFVEAVRQKVTTSARWSTEEEKPRCTTNIGFTFMGLYSLEVPIRTLQGMPTVFSGGMRARASMLGDRDSTKTEAEDPNWDKDWDPIWQGNRKVGLNGAKDVHIWVSINAQPISEHRVNVPDPEFEARTNWLMALADDSNDGIHLIRENGRNGDLPYQEASAIFDDFDGALLPTPKEHLGFSDGIGDPVFEGQLPPEKEKTAVLGRGKRVNREWQPLETGEFILGHPDESQELPPAARPPEFTYDGTFMAYRKLHENVGTFHEVINEETAQFAKAMDIPVEEARDTLLAKMCGRWSDGVPLTLVPDHADWIKFGQDKGWRDPKTGAMLKTIPAWKAQLEYIRSPEASDFRYGDDMAGFKCPVGSHLRRVNTRDYLDPLNTLGFNAKTGEQPTNADASSALNKRRRILRRGLPYGPPNFDHKDDETEQGVIMLIMGTSIERQFEFVQQQWIQYGLDFNQGNNTCPLLGDHAHHKRFTIASHPSSGKPPYIMSKLKTFVECRGGEYFFIPSMVALRMLAMGLVDPT
ncbi:Dyp-type peroxidase [Loktanella agnita]|uniref:Dyp-type peroxidase n=1 Tax=Loktanella agnita TaxID=287097 RepID=UPI00398652BE